MPWKSVILIILSIILLSSNCFAEHWVIKDPIFQGELEITDNWINLEVFNSFPNEHFCLITSGIYQDSKIIVGGNVPVAKVKIFDKSIYIEQLINDLQVCKYNTPLKVINPTEVELKLWKETLNSLEWVND